MVAIEKYHGTGNDFVVVDANEDVPDRRAFAMELCDRDRGISHPATSRTGADGVLFLALDDGYEPPRIVMTLVQPDGSVAAMCGNGARCAAAWATRRLTDGEDGAGRDGSYGDGLDEADDAGSGEVVIDTQAGTRAAAVSNDHVSIEMGTPTYAADAVPLDRDAELVEEEFAGLTVTAVNTGVPHAVAFVDDVTDVELAEVGPELRYDETFPEGTNVTIAARREDGGFDQRTYERGVEAETDSCGTGAVAIGSVAHRLGLVEEGESIAVHPPGGRLVVTVTDEGTILQGPVEREYAGEIASIESRTVDASGN